MKASISTIALLLFLAWVTGCGPKRSDSQKPAGTATLNVPESDEAIAYRPQIVHLNKLEVRNGLKYVVVGNGNGTFTLVCDEQQESCITPVPGVDYFLFTKDTKWKWPGAKEYATLQFFEDWSGSYNGQESVALVPVTLSSNGQWVSKGSWGIFYVESWHAKE